MNSKFNGLAPIYTKCKCECGNFFIKKAWTQRFCHQPKCAEKRNVKI